MLSLPSTYIKNLCRALLRHQKFIFDNGEVLNDDGAKFENLVANHLLKRLIFYKTPREISTN